jgi:hypothetical protein
VTLPHVTPMPLASAILIFGLASALRRGNLAQM